VKEWRWGRDGRLLGKYGHETRVKLFEACERLMLADTRYRTINTATIVREMVNRVGKKITNASFYQYWASADMLICEVYDWWLINDMEISDHSRDMVALIRREMPHLAMRGQHTEKESGNGRG
jgi:hypothetical protein